jgi:hypothetical protein
MSAHEMRLEAAPLKRRADPERRPSFWNPEHADAFIIDKEQNCPRSLLCQQEVCGFGT